jgi:acylphosphatase
MPETVPRLHCWVSGRVQGVWFRQSTHEQAQRLGLRGWVRNLPDGRVEAVFEGADKQLAFIREWLQHGPKLAKVEKVELRDEPEEGLQGFEVRH